MLGHTYTEQLKDPYCLNSMDLNRSLIILYSAYLKRMFPQLACIMPY